MADKSNIEWTDATWNPIVGCSIVSPGCTNCYAMKMASRIESIAKHPIAEHVAVQTHYAGTTKKANGKPVWTGKVALAPDHILTQPLRWKRGRRIFVNSMGDLFHENVPDEWIDKVFAVMALCPQHTFQVLTKRAEQMRAYMESAKARVIRNGDTHVSLSTAKSYRSSTVVGGKKAWPLPNVWLGVSTERQQEADERIPLLLQTPAAVRFISAEPLLGPIDLERINRVDERGSAEVNALGGEVYYAGAGSISSKTIRGTKVLDWVIVGGESGPGARPMHPDWARSLRDQCAAAGVPFFFKQWGEWLPGDANRGQFDERPMHAYRRCDDHSYQWPQHRETQNFGTHEDRFSGDLTTKRVGKKSAGRLLDGKEHNEFPIAQAEAS